MKIIKLQKLIPQFKNKTNNKNRGNKKTQISSRKMTFNKTSILVIIRKEIKVLI